MQPGCDEIEFLISKYVDGEATSEERVLVDDHIAGCDSCAYKFTSFMEMAALFSEAPNRLPDPIVRSNVFSDIHRLKEAERRREELPAAGYLAPIFAQSSQVPPRKPSIASRMWSFASPFAVMGTAVAALLVIMTLATPPVTNPVPVPSVSEDNSIMPGGIATQALGSMRNGGIPSPVVTRLVYSSPSSESATVRSTATFVGDRVLDLAEPTAVMEGGDPRKLSSWHLVRDPAYGYSVSYPPNWWTHVVGSTRYFFPWGPGGTRYAPYWIELRVEGNPQGYTAETANAAMFGGACKVESGSRGGGKCLRRSFTDETSVYDELYAFDSAHIYILRAKVPLDSSLADLETRWSEAQGVFARMSGSMALAAYGSEGPSGYGPVLFLNGSDLWSVNSDRSGARPLTRGYVVRQFALSPDLRHVAFAATNDFSKPMVEANYLYIVDSESDGPVTPRLLVSDLTIYDIAWYSDRELLAIGRSREGLFGVYVLAVASDKAVSIDTMPLLLTELSSEMRGARGLAVSPDRQLITFLAPLGEQKGTDIYALRPDGSDLRKIVAHNDPLPPELGVEDALTHENQAVKSYTWLDGRLENGKYYGDLLFTCGTYSSPTLYRGGFLYSAAGAPRGTMLNPFRLAVGDADKVQIVHVAYSSRGKVALTGFYNLRDGRAEVLAGLWTADVVNGNLLNLQAQPIPATPNGIADLQWSPDGEALIYREVLPRRESSMVSRYEGDLYFKMVRLDPESGEQTILYDATTR
ncbi:MAG TPA: zf-HC2 domain-containing protein [Chloroflexia bacterium]|nr:zf-HC2 domain-containing protein [Chloroflexia bacterium]